MSSQRQTQSSRQEYWSKLTSGVQNLSGRIINQRDQQNQGFVNFQQVVSQSQSIGESQDVENLINRIEQQLRDSSNAMILAEIHQFNSKSSKVSKESTNCPISESFSSISSKILLNYTILLRQLIQMRKKISYQENGRNLKSISNELEVFMKKYIAYTQLKYHNYYGDDQGGMMVMPHSKVNSLLQSLQKEVAKNNYEIKNKLNISSRSDAILKTLRIQNVKKILQNQTQQLVKETVNSFNRYKKLINKIDPQIKFRSKEYLSQLLGENNIISNSFKTSAKPTFIIKLMRGMLSTLKEKNESSKTFSIKQVKEDKLINAIRQKDLNIKSQQFSVKQVLTQKKQLKSEQVRKPKTNNQTQFRIEKLSETSQQSLSFSQFYRKTYVGEDQNDNLANQEQFSWQQVLKITYNYSKYIYEQTFQELANHLHLNIREESQAVQNIAALVQHALIQSKENSLMNAYIECNNQILVNILEQLNQLAVDKQILVFKVENNLRKENDHTIIILFAITQQIIIPCQLKIRLDQQLSTKKILRQNCQMFNDFMQSLKNSPFGVPGQMALYCLATCGSQMMSED